MRKFYEVIVNHRKTVIIVFFISVVICALCGTMVNVNYDMNDYLPDGTASILTLAGVLLWKISTHGVLSQLGHLLGRGTVLSTIIVLFVIPGMLYIFDTLIVLAQFGFSDVRQCLYGIVLIFIYTMVIDKILVMGAQKIEVKIISSKYEEIRKAILTNVDRGVTMLHGQTGYLLENTEVLINVISTRELVQVERLVKSIDEDAFMIISNVHEVQGRGFNLEKEYIEK